MEFVQTQKNIIMSPRKLRIVAGMVRKLKPTKAIDVLPHVGKRAAEPLMKVINACLSNAKNQGVSPEDLFIKEIQIGEGPRLKRGNPVSRGQWHPYKKRMSHIRVVLASVSKSDVQNTESVVKLQKEAKDKEKLGVSKTKRVVKKEIDKGGKK